MYISANFNKEARVSRPGKLRRAGRRTAPVSNLHTPFAPVIPGLVAGPRALFGSMIVERWQKGVHAERRIRLLRAALPGREVSTRTETRNAILGPPGTLGHVTVETVITYSCAERLIPPVAAPRPRAVIGGEVYS